MDIFALAVLEGASKKSVLERWEEIGLLEGCPEDRKQVTAEKYDSFARYCLNKDFSACPDFGENFSTLGVVIIRKIFSKNYANEVKNFSNEELFNVFYKKYDEYEKKKSDISGEIEYIVSIVEHFVPGNIDNARGLKDLKL